MLMVCIAWDFQGAPPQCKACALYVDIVLEIHAIMLVVWDNVWVLFSLLVSG